ncbi:polysaccharide deacetylase family protein [Actinoallomurus soli]|uniref:polysaccharide deacetylase family protein n=1 Tax=Actinoallomurus soli TaxID=2952535 RepID=UPI0020939712|nr:polysaccharide deacetylase family protein [Actinoallomurus soli]MCO5968281.1 polysaccharide deacetylase family protein [Actinoallomurus soli]
MRKLDRRQALWTFGAAGAGLVAGAVPEFLRGTGAPKAARHVRRPAPTSRPDPGYAHGRPLQALRRPIHSLHDLQPAAPPNAVALTIDDGPHPEWTPMMLDLLAELEVPATFSLIGVQVTEYPRLVRRIVAAGHQVSDHTVTHPLNLPELADTRVRAEIGGGHDRIAQISGVAPKFFRSPGGAWSQRIIDVAAEQSMICIDWQVDPRDWARPGTTTITDRLLRAQAGDILLCHDGGGDRSETIRALRTVIPALKQRGLTFVAL